MRGAPIDSERNMIDSFEKETTPRAEAEPVASSYEPPRMVSFGDAVQRTMGDEGYFAEKKAIAGLLGSGN